MNDTLNSTTTDTEELNTALPTIKQKLAAHPLFVYDDFSNHPSSHWDFLPETKNRLKANGLLDISEDNNTFLLRYTAANCGGVLALAKTDIQACLTSADYFVEMRVRPRFNTTASHQQLYLMARYLDGENWYAGGLTIVNSLGGTHVDIAKMKNGELSRLAKTLSPITQGKAGTNDGQWYNLRLVLKGSVLSVYLDGELKVSTTDECFTNTGSIGLWSDNKSFEIDCVKVGCADALPASMVRSPKQTEYAVELGDAARTFSVTTKNDDGLTEAFTATSSDPSVVMIKKINNEVTLTPVGIGSATIAFTSDSGLVQTITATISPKFEMPTATYQIKDQLFPKRGEMNAFEDTDLQLTFDSPPTLGNGSIRIYKTSDDSLADKINLHNESDIIGCGPLRAINTQAVTIAENTAKISIHSRRLETGVCYYAVVEGSAFCDATFSGEPFTGIGKNSHWQFTTRNTTPAVGKTHLIVGKNDPTADFSSIQSALNFVMLHVHKDAPATVFVRNGIYEEPLYLTGKNNLTLLGESSQGTLIQTTNNETMNSGPSGRALFLVDNVDLLTLKNLTIKNTTRIGEGHQAEALSFNSPDGRLIVTHSRFFSEQDTLHLKGWAWFYKTLIAGNVDFIWGYSKTALFEQCEIRTLADSRGNGSGGYILQARVEKPNDTGFVFLNCQLTRSDRASGYTVANNSTYLARSGGCGGDSYDNIVFIHTQMDEHIKNIGWLDDPIPKPTVATALSGWREYDSTNLIRQPIELTQRLNGYSYQLTHSEAQANYSTRTQIFAAYNQGEGWNPEAIETNNGYIE